MGRAIVVAALLTSTVLMGAPVWAVAPDLSIDRGTIQRGWLSNSKPTTDDVIFAWIPSASVFARDIYLLGQCLRQDDLGQPIGGHKVTFKNIELVGIDSGNTIAAENAVERLRNGVQEQVVWLLTSAARSLFADDSSILVSGQIKVNKRMAPFDVLTCSLAVAEVLDVDGVPAGAVTESPDGALPVVRGVDLPQLLRLPVRP